MASNNPELEKANQARIFGKLTAHEFMLEAFYANWIALWPEDHAEAFIADMLRLGKTIYGPISADADDIAMMQGMAAEANATLARLAEKALRRSKQIRAGIAAREGG